MRDTTKTRCGAPTAPTGLRGDWWCSTPFGGRSYPRLLGQRLAVQRTTETEAQDFELGMAGKRFTGTESASRTAGHCGGLDWYPSAFGHQKGAAFTILVPLG